MSLKYATIKDPHLRFGFNKPVGRSESFFDEISAKLDYIRQEMNNKDIKLLIIPGDILDIKAPHKYTYVQINKIIKELEKFTNDGIKILTIAGNHDLPFSSIEKKPDSIYQFLVNNNYIISVADDPYITDEYEIHGIDYSSPEESVFEKLDTIHAKLDTNKHNIVLMHQHFIPDGKDTLDFVSFFKYSSLTKYELVNTFIMGHLHKGYNPVFHKNKTRDQWYINQWSPVRLARDYYSVNDKHIPTMVTYIDNEFTTIELPCKSFDDSFIKMELKNDKSFNDGLDKFIKGMKGASLDTEDLIPPEEIKEKVMHYLQKHE